MAAFLLALVSLPVAAANAPWSTPEVRVGIVLFDGVQIIDFAGPYEVFGGAGFGVATLSQDGKPVTTEMGLQVTPDASFAEASRFDVLLVPGGDVAAEEKNPAMLAFLREQAAHSAHVLSVCTGSFILAGAGLLDGQEATTFTPRIAELGRRFPLVKAVRDVRWTDNGHIVTSAGLSSGMDAALHVVARIQGVERAQSLALHLEYDWKPDGGFVRSRMADRYIPRAWEKTVTWPEGLAMYRMISLGDTEHWRLRYKVTSTTPAADLLQLIATAIDTESAWTRQPGKTQWTSHQEGRSVVLTLDGSPASSDEDYQIGFTVDSRRGRDG